MLVFFLFSSTFTLKKDKNTTNKRLIVKNLQTFSNFWLVLLSFVSIPRVFCLIIVKKVEKGLNLIVVFEFRKP